ncbi:MAG: zinc ribbon domain-containing protein [Solobacterium sp.]|nr:zinc ribbon domain-containing protein [Solobacterium sp.]
MPMKCPVCGKELPDHAAFCDRCGSVLHSAQPDHKPAADPDGVYRWVCERPMLKSFFLLFEIWRAIGIAAAIIVLFMLVMNLLSGNGLKGAGGAFIAGILVFVILMVLSLPAYWIATKANNGKYTVLFEMDENGIDHTQIKTDKARALEALTMLAGAKTKNYTMTGAGMLSAAGTSLYTRFSAVRKIQADASKCLIRLKGKLIRNQVYTDPEHYDFVLDYITSRCPQAEITRK